MSSIENSQDYKADLTISGSGLLVKFSEKGKSDISLSYDSYTGLLTSRTGGDNVIKVKKSTMIILSVLKKRVFDF